MKEPSGGFGEMLRRHRLSAAMTQRELADRAGVSVRTVRDIEQGRVGRPHARSVRRLAAAVGGDDHAELLAAAGLATGAVTGIRLSVLGPLDLRRDGVRIEIRSARLRQLLGLLAVQPRQAVGHQEIIDVLWGEEPPRTCLSLVHTYVRQLRDLLDPRRRRRAPADLLVLAPGGYKLEVDEQQLDLRRFDALRARARRARETGDPHAAYDLYRQALACHRGRVVADLGPRLRHHPAAVAVAERRLAAALAYAELAAELGHDQDAAEQLQSLAGDEPMHERLHARLMLALARSGRQTAALELHTTLRARLVEELGVEPGPEIQDAHLQVLRPAAARWTAQVPAQLPAAATAFTGRAASLRRLRAFLDDAAVVAIVGTAGVGKTALAVQWAHQVRDRFPDGQLYVDLRGYSPVPPLRPAEVLVWFLQALGVPGEQIPVGLDEAAGLYRSMVADRQLLVVLDNARDAEHVRPLLPGGSGCLALVTSRDRLSGLVAREGARRIALDVLEPREARALLARVLGTARTAAEQDATDALAAGCAHLPLALRIAAANLINHPRATIASYVAELRDSGRGLAALEADGDPLAAVGVAFDLSYAALGEEARRLFRRLGFVPGPDVGVPVAAALAGTDERRAARVLEQLAAAHLVSEPLPRRFTCHDLLRQYARDRADSEETGADATAAMRRIFDHYVDAVDAAARLLYPDMLRLPTAEDRPARVRHADHSAALAWLDAERPNLVAAVRHAADHGPREAAWRIADSLRGYFWARMCTMDWLAVTQAALAAAVDAPQARAAARLSLGDLHLRQGRYADAIEHYAQALALDRQTGWQLGEVAALCNLGVVYWQTGRLRQAADHFTRAHAINLETGRLEGQAATMGNLGLVYRELGRLPEAASHYMRAVELDRMTGSRMGEAIDLANVGEAYHLLGQPGRAVECLNRALALHREVGDRDTEGDTLHRLAAVHRDAGRHASALALAREALDLARDTGNQRVEADASNTLATVHHELGDYRAAIDHHERALKIATTAGDRHPQVQALVGLAAACELVGELDEAAALAQRALTMAGEAEYRVLEGLAAARLAAVRLAQRSPERALRLARRALDLHRASGYRLGQAQAHMLLARALDRTDPPAARSHRHDASTLLADLADALPGSPS